MKSFIKSKLDSARRSANEVEEKITSFDDALKLGAYETKTIGKYFRLKAQGQSNAGELMSLSDAFDRAGTAILKSLERNGYILSDDDEAAYKRVDAWKEAFSKNPDSVVEHEINEFLSANIEGFIREYPESWVRLSKKDPILAKKLRKL